MEALLDTLYSENYTLKKQITVKLKKDEDEYVAELKDANLGATGSDIKEALINLADIILMNFLHLKKLSDKKLGKDMLATKIFLNEVVIRKEE